MQDRRSVTPRPPNSNTLLGRNSGQVLRRELCKLRVRNYDSVEYPALLVKAKHSTDSPVIVVAFIINNLTSLSISIDHHYTKCYYHIILYSSHILLFYHTHTTILLL